MLSKGKKTTKTPQLESMKFKTNDTALIYMLC